MDMREMVKLTKMYAECKKCGSDSVEDGQGTLEMKDDVFTRTCKCGWSVKVDKRIKVVAHATKKKNGITTGIVEVRFHDCITHKYLDLTELKRLSGVARVSQTKKIEEWLNTEEGRKWALSTPHKQFF